ncbi:hypothetical protein [Streptomyces sp. NPDC052225]|uniref:hypothetical protein n=1 Tax=Streptomyces sp. NPDC052225 TaxID=3154949 RepID=UPI0034160C8E
METHPGSPPSALARLADTYGVDTAQSAPEAATALCSCALDVPSRGDHRTWRSPTFMFSAVIARLRNRRSAK